MSKLTKRLFALFLVLCLVLTGCAQEEKSSRRKSKKDKEKEETTQQLQMPQEELTAALQTIELSTIAATAAKDEFTTTINGGYNAYAAYLGDADGDGDIEFVYGCNGTTFDPSGAGKVVLTEEHYGNTFFTDHDGNLYLEGFLSDDWPEYSLYYVNFSEWYKKWDGEQWNHALEYAYDAVYYNVYDLTDIDENTAIKEKTATATINGEEVSEDTFLNHKEEIGLEMVNAKAADMTIHNYDIAYQDQLLDALDTYFSERYPNYRSRIVGDFDNDGDKETLFLLPDHLGMWKEKRTQDEPVLFDDDINFNTTRTGVMLADPKEDVVTFQAYCINGYYAPENGASVTYENNTLYVGDYSFSQSMEFETLNALDDATRTAVLGNLENLLKEYSYTNTVMKLVDLADVEGDEVLCVSRKNGTWYIIIFAFRRGTPHVAWQADMSNNAYYLVEKDGKQCLMSYYQRVTSTGSGYNAEYSYDLLRFTESCSAKSVESRSASFTNRDSNAAKTSQFFEDFNKYITQVVVISDPYALTNQQWLSQEQADIGTVPENTVTIPERDEDTGRLGFVQIEDPESWLNLREGPGTQYSQVLLDPYNPNSFVKQALGSPVTVLDEIVTGDPENPVWVKIRIHYGDREIVGYSSKRFIRMAEYY